MITALFAPYVSWIIGLITALISVFAIRQSGKNAERNKSNAERLQRDNEAKNEQIQRMVDSPHTTDDVIDSLRKGDF